MTDVASSLTRTVARQYDLFQASLELVQKDRKFLNYGYTVSGTETLEARQERLCLEVFQAAAAKTTSSSTSASAAENRTSSCRMRASSGA